MLLCELVWPNKQKVSTCLSEEIVVSDISENKTKLVLNKLQKHIPYVLLLSDYLLFKVLGFDCTMWRLLHFSFYIHHNNKINFISKCHVDKDFICMV